MDWRIGLFFASKDYQWNGARRLQALFFLDYLESNRIESTGSGLVRGFFLDCVDLSHLCRVLVYTQQSKCISAYIYTGLCIDISPPRRRPQVPTHTASPGGRGGGGAGLPPDSPAGGIVRSFVRSFLKSFFRFRSRDVHRMYETRYLSIHLCYIPSLLLALALIRRMAAAWTPPRLRPTAIPT